MIFLILFAFLSGIMTIFAPCIWPLLPIVLSAGASGGERRPFGIIVGLMVSFTFFTLTLSYILKIIPIDVVTLRLFAIITIALLGLALVVPRFGTFLEAGTSRLFGTRGNFLQKREGFKGGFITGVALGLVWSPCAGPILATVATLAATQTLNFSVILVTVAFVVGVALPLFILALLGRHFFTKARMLSPYTVRVQQIFGVVIILSAVALFAGWDVMLQEKFSAFCSENGITVFDRFQVNPIVTDELENLQKEGNTR